MTFSQTGSSCSSGKPWGGLRRVGRGLLSPLAQPLLTLEFKSEKDLCNDDNLTPSFKGIVHRRNKIWSLITHPHIVPQSQDRRSSLEFKWVLRDFWPHVDRNTATTPGMQKDSKNEKLSFDGRRWCSPFKCNLKWIDVVIAHWVLHVLIVWHPVTLHGT